MSGLPEGPASPNQFGVVDVSVEVLHSYDYEAGGHLEAQAQVEASWLRPVLETLERNGKTTSINILLDDGEGEEAHTESALVIAEAWRKTGLVIDRVVFESSLSDAAEVLARAYIGEEAKGDFGQLGAYGHLPPIDSVGERRNWLSNSGQQRPSNYFEQPETTLRRMEAALLEGERPRTAGGSSRYGMSHSLSLDIELWDGKPPFAGLWSCAWLSAAWQFVRLGGAPGSIAEVAVCTDAAPLAGHQTLTLLPSKLIEVEHAVRTILSRMVLVPEHFLSGAQISSTADALSRVNYLFCGSRLV